MTDPYKELRDNRAALLELFASKGWEIWLSWAKTQIAGHFEAAVRNDTAEEREEARVTGLALEKFSRLPFFLMEQAESSAEQAPTHFE